MRGREVQLQSVVVVIQLNRGYWMPQEDIEKSNQAGYGIEDLCTKKDNEDLVYRNSKTDVSEVI